MAASSSATTPILRRLLAPQPPHGDSRIGAAQLRSVAALQANASSTNSGRLDRVRIMNAEGGVCMPEAESQDMFGLQPMDDLTKLGNSKTQAMESSVMVASLQSVRKVPEAITVKESKSSYANSRHANLKDSKYRIRTDGSTLLKRKFKGITLQAIFHKLHRVAN